MFMDILKLFVYRKDLLRLGLKNTHITPIISQAAVFKNISKQKGYAIQFDFKQAVLIAVGCELFKLGLPFRHVDLVLNSLSAVEISPSKLDLMNIEEVGAEAIEMVKAAQNEIAYLVIQPGPPLEPSETRSKTTPLFIKIYMRNEDPLSDFHNNKYIDSFFCIMLAGLISKVTWLFNGKL